MIPLRAESNRPLRVALVHASDFGGGAERSVVTLHRALRNAGHDSTLFVGHRATDEPGVVQIPYARGLPGSRRVARAIERRMGWQDIYNPSFRGLESLLRQAFDVVHFNSLWGSSAYADLSALPKITRHLPGIVTMRDEWLVTGHCACFHSCERWKVGCGSCPDLTLAPSIARDGTAFNWRRKRSAVQRSRLHIVAISDHLKRIAEASPILSGKPITRIYNGIDLDTFHPLDEAARRALRRELGFGDEERVVIIAGQTVEGMRQGIATHHAIAALNALTDEPNVRVCVVGHSSTRVGAQLRLSHSAFGFQTRPDDMARLFQAADIALVTSEVEAFGRIAAEAQACGTPVVAFAAGGVPEVVRDEVGGLVVPLGDVPQLTTSLRRLLVDTEEARALGREGRSYVADHFDQSQVARQYESLYLSVLAQTASRAA